MSDRSNNNKVVVADTTGTETTHHLRNMRVRSPSEHTIDGNHLPAELQVFFTDEDDGTHVLSYFIEIAEDDSEDLTTFLASETYGEGWFSIDDDNYSEFNFADLLSFSSNFWTYSGSLTDEDCDQGVNWTVFKEFLYITEGQLDVLQSRMLADADTYMGNNRVVQEGDRIAGITVYQDNDTYEISAFTDYDFVDATECTADVDDCAEEEDDSDEDGECETDDEDCETDGEGPDDSDAEEDSCETDDEDCEADDEEDSCETDDEDCEADDDDDDDDDDSETPDAAFSLATSTAAIAMAAVFAF